MEQQRTGRPWDAREGDLLPYCFDRRGWEDRELFGDGTENDDKDQDQDQDPDPDQDHNRAAYHARDEEEHEASACGGWIGNPTPRVLQRELTREQLKVQRVLSRAMQHIEQLRGLLTQVERERDEYRRLMAAEAAREREACAATARARRTALALVVTDALQAPGRRLWPPALSTLVAAYEGDVAVPLRNPWPTAVAHDLFAK